MGMDLDRIRKGAPPAAATAVMAADAAYAAASRTMVAPPPVPPDAAARPPSSPPPRRTWPWLLAIGLGILVAALAGYLFLDLGGSSGGGGTATTTSTVAVQDVRGFSAASAASALQKQGLVVEQAQAFSDKPQGTVADQNPPAGTVVDVGSTVTITISKGQDLVAVEDVTGKTYDAAKPILTGDGFKVKKKSQSDDTIPKNQVISQSPAGGTQAQRGSEVVLVVSSGPAAVTVPVLINMKQADATQALADLGLQTSVVQAASTVYKAGRVSAQDPASGQQVPKGSTVTITVSTGPPPVDVPDVTGKTQASAEATLTNDGLKVTTETVPVTDPSQDGIVQATDPAAGTSVKPGSTVVLQVGHFGP
jgi:eukaryotic-like serine/threonine-protein kinase